MPWKTLARFPLHSRALPPAPADRWAGEKGGLPAALTRLLPVLDDHEAYLCGGPGMIDASISALKAKGLGGRADFLRQILRECAARIS